MPPEARQDWREIVLVAAALRTGLIAALAEGGTLEDASRAAGLDLRASRIAVGALQDLGYTVERDGRVDLTAAGRALLAAGAGSDPAAEILLGERAIRNHLRLDRVLRGEQPSDDVSEGDAETRAAFMAAMRHIASGRAPLVAGYVPPPRRGARLLDVGGAPGTYATAFAAAGWEVTVFDLPATLEAVARDLEARGVDRVGGDMTVGLPDGPWDAVYLGNVLHLFDRETARAIVARAAGVLGPGGRLAIQEMMLGRAPQAAAFAVMMLVSTAAGDTYAEEDYRRWMREAGVAPQSIVDLDGREHQLLIGRRDG